MANHKQIIILNDQNRDSKLFNLDIGLDIVIL